jgi:hypothetical protein
MKSRVLCSPLRVAGCIAGIVLLASAAIATPMIVGGDSDVDKERDKSSLARQAYKGQPVVETGATPEETATGNSADPSTSPASTGPAAAGGRAAGQSKPSASGPGSGPGAGASPEDPGAASPLPAYS